MAQAQLLLFPDPRPLVERFGPDFFRNAPEAPGVYLMRDAAGVVLYVGKAINIRRRLCSYRVANPDRMGARHLRLLRAVASIDFEECEDEEAALGVEARLLRSLRPRFNRAGTWGGLPQHVIWRIQNEFLEINVSDEVEPGWETLGFCYGAWRLRNILARVLWISAHPDLGFTYLPHGWLHPTSKRSRRIHCGNQIQTIRSLLQAIADGRLPNFEIRLAAFDATALQADLEMLNQRLASLRAARRCAN